MSTVKEQIEKLSKMNPSEHVALIVWHTEDVIENAKECGIKLTKKQAETVLFMLERKHDATIGINWDTIAFWVDQVKADSKRKSGKRK